MALALLSVSDKTGLVDFARGLVERGFELLSTGGTLSALASAAIPVTSVEAYTGSPEVMAGRVKTLHPRVHGGILMRGEIDLGDLERIGGRRIDLVCVNLYPFEQTLKIAGSTVEDLIEKIDIGGPSMVRSAAKNHGRVWVVTDPSDYELVLSELAAAGGAADAPTSAGRATGTRRRLAAKAFAKTSTYDAAIAGWLSSIPEQAPPGDVATRDPYPPHLILPFERVYGLRYGENPHQSAAFYREPAARPGSLAFAESLGAGGKELSFNNLVDADAALEAVREHDAPAAVVVKHTNPCGVATGPTLESAYRAARAADETSAFGGIVAVNREVDEGSARALAETFLECVIAPAFSEAALGILRTKKNLRLLATGAWLAADHVERAYRRVGGGLLVQDRDATGPLETKGARVVTQRAPTDDELAALGFAWLVVKHVKSNAIVLAQPGRTVGVGAGQMSRVESVRIACSKAGEGARGAVLASDAFFPFPDRLELALAAGVTAVVQPGGSVKDPDVVAAADAAGAAMIFTGVRHFRH
ncbi:MAG TPA: bifunctional phosphoribosylaminoimidazolecarboxamide formyltransferase/IMP cyclohydrolase [Polyangiaceae bacterium]|nr:bifunctional phosphoribosylaminoimidazolecarboxamide formyltransferase/IMP cyclohydrolase [Polyangiaceae bacterium]